MSTSWGRIKSNTKYRAVLFTLWILPVIIFYAAKPDILEINTYAVSSDIMWGLFVATWTWAMMRLYGFVKAKTPQDILQIGAMVHTMNLKIDTLGYDIKELYARLPPISKVTAETVEVKTT